MTTPCSNCPFRNDIKPYLYKERIAEILNSLNRGQFPCHKTVSQEDEDPYDDECQQTQMVDDEEIHCAGALILLEKMERPSQMMRILERVGLYDRTKLKMDSPVYDSFGQMLSKGLVRGKRAKVRNKESKHTTSDGDI